MFYLKFAHLQERRYLKNVCRQKALNSSLKCRLMGLMVFYHQKKKKVLKLVDLCNYCFGSGMGYRDGVHFAPGIEILRSRQKFNTMITCWTRLLNLYKLADKLNERLPN